MGGGARVDSAEGGNLAKKAKEKGAEMGIGLGPGAGASVVAAAGGRRPKLKVKPLLWSSCVGMLQ